MLPTPPPEPARAPTQTSVLAYIGLGANLGAARHTLLSAASRLGQLNGIDSLRLSPLYASAPLDAAGPDYVNAVAAISTSLTPHDLLAQLQAIELAYGRTRPYRNAPRTLDLDLLSYASLQLDSATLSLPHPRMHQRAFVLQPLYDLAPGLCLAQGSLASLLAACSTQDIKQMDKEQQRPLIKLVVAYTDDRVIGKDGGMPWHLPNDLAHFKRHTMGQPIIMGRQTWESIGRPLPGRRNLVLSRSAEFQARGAECFTNLNAALRGCAGEPAVCVIGGEQIFRLALPLADEIIATEIHADIAGDTFFPPLPAGQWRELERQPQAAENGLSYDFVHYVKLAPQPQAS